MAQSYYQSWIGFLDSGDYFNLPPASKGALEIIAEISGKQAALLLVNACIENYGKPIPLEGKLVTSE